MADVVTGSQLYYHKLHKALLQATIKFCLISPAGISSQNNLLNVSLPGVELREGGHQWLTDNVMLAKVRMIPLQITANNTLDCILYKRQVNISSQTPCLSTSYKPLPIQNTEIFPAKSQLEPLINDHLS